MKQEIRILPSKLITVSDIDKYYNQGYTAMIGYEYAIIKRG